MGQNENTDPYTLTWIERAKVRWRGETLADATLAKLIEKTEGAARRWNSQGVQDLFCATIEQGANLDLALERALGQNAAAAEALLDRGAQVTETGLMNLARWVIRWEREVDDEWWDASVDQWPALDLAKRLINEYPRHTGWLQRIPDKQQTVINKVICADDELRALYQRIAPWSEEEEVRQLLTWYDPVKHIKSLVRGQLGKMGEQVSGSVQLALVDYAMARRPALKTDLELAELALSSRSWDVARNFRKHLGGFPEDLLLRTISTLSNEVPSGEVHLPLEDEELVSFMGLLAEDLPADFDFERKIKVIVDGMYGDDEYNFSIRQLCGNGFRVLDAHRRRRKLMAEVGNVISERTQDDLPRGPRM